MRTHFFMQDWLSRSLRWSVARWPGFVRRTPCPGSAVRGNSLGLPARPGRNRTECARPRAQQHGAVEGHRYDPPPIRAELPAAGTAALQKIAAACQFLFACFSTGTVEGDLTMSEAPTRTSSDYLIGIGVFLGAISWGTVLGFHNVADGDLWAKLALGAFIWNRGEILQEDKFAFTPVLPEYIDHEWGAGAIFYGALKLFGPVSLLWLKILLAFGALTTGLLMGRRNGCRWPALLWFALPG